MSPASNKKDWVSSQWFYDTCRELAKKMWPRYIAKELGISRQQLCFYLKEGRVPVEIFERAQKVLPELLAAPYDPKKKIWTFMDGKGKVFPNAREKREFRSQITENERRKDRLRKLFPQDAERG